MHNIAYNFHCVHVQRSMVKSENIDCKIFPGNFQTHYFRWFNFTQYRYILLLKRRILYKYAYKISKTQCFPHDDMFNLDYLS